MATLFEGMWHGDIPSLTVMKSEERGIMAILANPQETAGQLVVFPRRPVATIEELSRLEDDYLNMATRALTRRLKSELGVDRVVRHVEGYGVPNHAHAVLLPSYGRGDSDRIHHPQPRMSQDEFEVQFADIQQRLMLPEGMFEAEIAARQAYYNGLREDAT